MKGAARMTALCIVALAGLGCERPATKVTVERDAAVDVPRSIASSAPVAEAVAGRLQLLDGDEIFAIEPSAVKEVQYETPARILAATRPVGGGPRFAMVEKNSNGREIRRCLRKESFDRTFHELYSIRIRSTIARDRVAVSQTGGNAKLRILSVVEGEPSEWDVAPINDPDPQLTLLAGNAAYVLALSPALVMRLAQGCGSPSGTK
jgi:hypothetical protein